MEIFPQGIFILLMDFIISGLPSEEEQGLAVARSPSGENDYQSFSKTLRSLRYPPYGGGFPRIGGDLDLRVVSSYKSSPKVGKMTLGEL